MYKFMIALEFVISQDIPKHFSKPTILSTFMNLVRRRSRYKVKNMIYITINAII